jgi:NTP pyrophosphatase (non-canonical NTP hydrolase)
VTRSWFRPGGSGHTAKLARDRTDVATSQGAALDIRDARKRAWDNKVDKGFNTTDVALEFGLLTAEVGEAFTAWRKRKPDFGEELADIAIYVIALAEMNGIDLDQEIDSKIHKNVGRTYVRDEHGTLQRVDQ